MNLKTFFVLTLSLLLALVACDYMQLDGDSSSSSGSSGTKSGSTAETIVDSIGTLTLNLPDTLQSSDSSPSSTIARTSVNYDSLDDVPSHAYDQLMDNIERLTQDAESINTIFGMIKEAIEGGLEEDQVYEGTFTGNGPDGYGTYNSKLKYSFETSGDVEYLVALGGCFTETDELMGACYIEARIIDESAETVEGQAMFTGQYTDEETNITFHSYSKIAFNTETDVQEGYHYMTNGTDSELDHGGMVRITPDSSDSNNGVYVATHFDGWYGQFIELGWANDNYGGVQNWGQWEWEGSTEENIYSEYFTLSTGEAKIVFREWGTEDASHIYWDVNSARNNFDSGIFDAATVIPSSAPDYISIKSNHSSHSSFEVYSGEFTISNISGETAAATVSEDPYNYWRIVWLTPGVTPSTTITSGDAAYRMKSVTEDGSQNFVAVFEKVVEVPDTTSRFGYSGFYTQSMYPLKYVTGSFSNSETIIQYEQVDWNGNNVLDPEDDWNGNNVADDYIYFIDKDGDGEFDDFDSGANAEQELMVWDMQEWDSDTVTSWLMGEIPSYTDGDGNTISYTYNSEKAAVDAKFSNITEDDYISTISYPDFPIAEEAFPTITADSF
jgi:hypothetical protein